MLKLNWKCLFGLHQWRYEANMCTSKPDFLRPIKTSILKRCKRCGVSRIYGALYRKEILYLREQTFDEMKRDWDSECVSAPKGKP